MLEWWGSNLSRPVALGGLFIGGNLLTLGGSFMGGICSSVGISNGDVYPS